MEFKGEGVDTAGAKKPKETQWTKFTVLMDDLDGLFPERQAEISLRLWNQVYRIR